MPVFISQLSDLRTAPPSSGWQVVFVSFAAAVILLEIVRGWRLGLMRQLARVVAILAAYGCAIFGGRAAVPVARSFFKLPDALLASVSGVVLALLVYAIITSAGSILFKRTSQQSNAMGRVIWGSGGALLGLLFGAFAVWLVFVGVRLIGSVAQAQVHSHQALTSATIQPVWNRPLQIQGKQPPTATQDNGLVETLAEMKASLESGRIGHALKTNDPVPETTYLTLEKLGGVASNVDSAQRFLAFPGAREISEHPKVVALRNDPEVADLIAHGHILELLQNQRLIDAMNDRTLRDRLRNFELQRALDYALSR